MTFDEYTRKAVGTLQISKKKALQLAVFGLAGELGEVVEPIKKHLFHGKFTREEVKAKVEEELGDLYWYGALLASCLDLNLEEIHRKNIEKLLRRYPERAEQARHSACGRGDESGPFDADCDCRGSDQEEACAVAGCGFCWRGQVK